MSQQINLNVSDLEPPEPMQVILNALAFLNKGEFLAVKHRRKPEPLFSIIQEQGFSWKHHEFKADHHYILIWKTEDLTAQNQALTSLNKTLFE